MIKQIIYSDEEKAIIENHLLHQDTNCKKDYYNYLENYIAKFGKEVDEHLKQPVKHNHTSIMANLNNWIYNSHNIIWGNEKNDNVVTYILSHPKFKGSNTRIKELVKLQPNWNHANNDGDTALHLLAKRKNIFHLKKIIEDLKLKEVKNNNGDYFSYTLINSKYEEINEKQHYPLSIENEYLKMCLFVIEERPHHFEEASIKKLAEMETNLSLLKEKILKIQINKEQSMMWPNPDSFIKETVIFLESIQKKLNYYHLEKSITTNENKKKRNKL